MATIFDSLLAHLDSCKLPQIEEVSQATGVPYHTIAKIKRRETLNPRIDTVQKLLAHFNRPQRRKAKAEA
jgi:transcriptional regulator with XRE-family HTH domain